MTSRIKGKCSIAVSSVVGHVFGLDFDEMTGSDPINLFGAHTRKHVAENATSFGVLESLLELAEGVDFLYLWLVSAVIHYVYSSSNSIDPFLLFLLQADLVRPHGIAV